MLSKNNSGIKLATGKGTRGQDPVIIQSPVIIISSQQHITSSSEERKYLTETKRNLRFCSPHILFARVRGEFMEEAHITSVHMAFISYCDISELT